MKRTERECGYRICATPHHELTATLPDLPTLSESGLPGEATLGYGLLLPAGTPPQGAVRYHAPYGGKCTAGASSNL